MYDKLFGQMVRWSMRPAGGSGKFTVATEVADGQVRVVVNALDKNDEFLNFLSMNATAVGPDMKPVPMRIEQTSPGRYVGTLPGPRRRQLLRDDQPRRGPGADPRRRDRALLRRVPRPDAQRCPAGAACRDRAQGRAGRQAHRAARTTSSKTEPLPASRTPSATICPRPPAARTPGTISCWRPVACCLATCSAAGCTSISPGCRRWPAGPAIGSCAASRSRPRRSSSQRLRSRKAEVSGPFGSASRRRPLRAFAGNAGEPAFVEADRRASGDAHREARRPLAGRAEAGRGKLYGTIAEGEEEGLGGQREK